MTKYKFAAAAAAAMLAGAALPANAIVVSGGSAPGTIDLTTATEISVGDILTAEIFFEASDIGSGAGSEEFSVSATEGLFAIETSSLNPVGGLTNPYINVFVNNILQASVSPATADAVFVSLMTNDVLKIVAGWDDVVRNGTNIDVRVEAFATPIPAAGLVFLTGLAGAVAARRKKAKA